jgi:predicted small metal-binding protein
MHLLCSSATNLPLVPVHHLSAASPGYLVGPLTGAEETIPALSFCCRDIGLDCSCEITGKTRSGILREFIRHAESSHNMAVLSAEILLKMKESMNK